MKFTDSIYEKRLSGGEPKEQNLSKMHPDGSCYVEKVSYGTSVSHYIIAQAPGGLGAYIEAFDKAVALLLDDVPMVRDAMLEFAREKSAPAAAFAVGFMAAMPDLIREPGRETVERLTDAAQIVANEEISMQGSVYRLFLMDDLEIINNFSIYGEKLEILFHDICGGDAAELHRCLLGLWRQEITLADLDIAMENPGYLATKKIPSRTATLDQTCNDLRGFTLRGGPPPKGFDI